MTRRHVCRAVLGLAALLGSALAAAAPLHDLNGQPRSLADYTGQGRWLVVMIWASDCLICNAEAPAYARFQARHGDVRVLGVSMDGAAQRADAEHFVAEHRLNFPNLIGEPEDVAGLWVEQAGQDWVGTPSFLIFGPDGRLRAQRTGRVRPARIERFIREHTESP